MKDKTLQKLLKLLHDGFLRELFGKEKTLKQLRAKARLRGFNNTSKLKKAQLKNLLSKPQDLDQLRKRNLMVKAKKFGIKNAAKLKKSQLIDTIDDKAMKLKEEKQSSFRGFKNQFTLEPNDDTTYDPESFLSAVKRKALSKIQTQNKVNIILRVNMEKTDLKTGQSLVTTHDIYLAHDHNLSSRIVFLDISKAFDRIVHTSLLFKLKQLGIVGSLLNLITSYLEYRSQVVHNNGSTSEICYTNCGVPQGSVLGPLLFLIYVNDISDNIQSSPFEEY